MPELSCVQAEMISEMGSDVSGGATGSGSLAVAVTLTHSTLAYVQYTDTVYINLY